MKRLFGTDGVRGVAITELTCDLAMNIGKALAVLISRDMPDDEHPTIIIGKDTRRSSDILEAALVAGITAAGGDAQLLGIVPTPAVAFLINKYKANAGVMITASHNSAEFNGIKLFNGEGLKFPDEREDMIEAYVHNPDSMPLKNGGEVGTINRNESGIHDYSAMISSLSDGKYEGLKMLVDCANGSASVTAKEIFAELGDDCVIIKKSPNGMNINEKCGSTYIDILGKKVVDGSFDLGIAFDGDADRMLAVDGNGNMVDGDKIIAMLSVYMREKGELNNDTAVVTVMSNLGFHQYMRKNGIKTAVVKVGDRYVLEEMIENDYSIGGEQSGHIIFKQHATTGDGMLTAIKLLNMLKEKGVPLAEMVSEIPTFPQTLKNVVIDSKNRGGAWRINPAITATIKEIEEIAGVESRILIRESGTEPLLRVMIEGKNQADIEEWADRICEVVKRELG